MRCVQFYLVVVLLSQVQVLIDLALGPAFASFFFNSLDGLMYDKGNYNYIF